MKARACPQNGVSGISIFSRGNRKLYVFGVHINIKFPICFVTIGPEK
jgi:hypothetical protein